MSPQESVARPTISVLMITLNEERRLDEVLESVRWADEIVIVDSGSTDRTEEIARRHNARFVVQPWEGEGLQRRRSLELASGEWIFYLDGDEVVTPELRASIQRAVADPGEHAGFEVELRTWFAGQWLGGRGWRRERKPRLFRRDRGRFREARIHSGAIIDGPVGRLKGVLLHYPYRDIEHFAEKMNRYSSGVARDYYERGRRSGPLWPVVRGVVRFLRDWIGGGDFLYGGAGFVRSGLMGYYAFLTFSKLWELEQGSEAPPEPSQPLLMSDLGSRT